MPCAAVTGRAADMNRAYAIVIAVVLVVFLISLSVFTVDQRQYALVLQFGEITQVVRQPGLHFKIPLIQNVKLFDNRIITLDITESEGFLTSEKKNVLVDYFVKWRIDDVTKYYTSMGEESKAQTRLAQTINDGLRAELGKRTIHDVISGERDQIMDEMRVKANVDAATFGVAVIDVRLRRVDLQPAVSESIYRRMESERKRVANELRSTGSAEAEKIRADADRQREIIVAEAYRDAQKTKGEGDAKASAIYAAAFGQNAEFYSFYRSLDAYRQSFRSKGDVLVVEPTSEFFKYLKNPGKTGK
jgi:membrane protease subunit HflC